MTVTTKEPNYSSHAFLTPANLLTFGRMAATPVVLVLIAQRKFDFVTLALWGVVCMTDWFDGILARRYGVSKSGAFLDPLADKLLVLGAMVVLVFKREFWIVPVALIAVREIAMSVYRSVVGTKGVSIPARQSAKYKTFVQQICVTFAIMPWVGQHANWIGQVLLWVSVALTLYTGAQYFFAARALRPTN
jgi:CDP-diacylglycerol---glycerol-3-phosphate 3-phosphatidyltransferase